jgi:hypothetical protein
MSPNERMRLTCIELAIKCGRVIPTDVTEAAQKFLEFIKAAPAGKKAK